MSAPIPEPLQVVKLKVSDYPMIRGGIGEAMYCLYDCSEVDDVRQSLLTGEDRGTPSEK